MLGDNFKKARERRDGRPYSVCPDLVSCDECLVSAWDIINARKRQGGQSPWMHLLESYAELGLADAELQLTKMFVCDYILVNRDRHWNNLGVVFDAATMQAKRVAPIYDSGSSLWNNVFELAAPADYWYRPLLLVRERARRILPEDQLALMRDFSWLDAFALDGFAGDVREVLSASTRLSARPHRCDRARCRAQHRARQARRPRSVGEPCDVRE